MPNEKDTTTRSRAYNAVLALDIVIKLQSEPPLSFCYTAVHVEGARDQIEERHGHKG